MDKGDTQADVVVVDAGPAGSSTAHCLAMAGLRALLLGESTFPRDRVYGDDLMLRAVAELVRTGVDTSGWARNTGLRAIGGGRTIELPQFETASPPNFGLARPRAEPDAMLAAKTQESGAILCENITVVGLILHGYSGRVVGVKVKSVRHEPLVFETSVVVGVRGVPVCLTTTTGHEEVMNRPVGVTYRTYFHSERPTNFVMESHLELQEGEPGKSDLILGYGWISPLAGEIVSVDLRSLSSTAKATGLGYRAMFKAWMVNAPSEWGFVEKNQAGRLYDIVLPVVLSCEPCCTDGLPLVGDTGSIVSPFNGEGIAYTLQAGRFATDTIAQAHSCPTITAKDRALAAYPAATREGLDGYYSLGWAFVRFIERLRIMCICIAHGLLRSTLMRLVTRLLSDCCDHREGDWMDRLVSALAKAALKV